MIAADFAASFSQYANQLARREKDNDVIGILLNDHRTLQQSMMRFCIAFIEGMATNGHDLRNEASVKLAQEIVAKCPNRALPLI